MRYIKYILVLASMMAMVAAQAQTETQPTYRLTLLVDHVHPGCAVATTTNGYEFAAGETANIKLELGDDHELVKWIDNDGAVVSLVPDFDYEMPAHDVTLTAEVVKYSRIYLQSNKEGIGKFNPQSGERFREGEKVSIIAFQDGEYTPVEWTENGETLIEGNRIEYTVGHEDSHLVCCYKYDPASPNEPGTGINIDYPTVLSLNIETVPTHVKLTWTAPEPSPAWGGIIPEYLWPKVIGYNVYRNGWLLSANINGEQCIDLSANLYEENAYQLQAIYDDGGLSVLSRAVNAKVKLLPPKYMVDQRDVYIYSDFADAEIYYALNENDPVTNGTLYQAPLHLDEDCLISAYATGERFFASEVSTYFYERTDYYCSKPEIYIDPHGVVVMQCETPESQIRYTLDGRTPTSASTLYDGPFQLTRNCLVKAIATKDRWIDSEVAAVNFDGFKCEMPAIVAVEDTVHIHNLEPDALVMFKIQRIDLKDDPDYTLYYGPVEIPYNSYISAYAVKDGYHNSDTTTVVVDWIRAKNPIFIGDGGGGVSIYCESSLADIICAEYPNPLTENSNRYSPSSNDGEPLVLGFDSLGTSIMAQCVGEPLYLPSEQLVYTCINLGYLQNNGDWSAPNPKYDGKHLSFDQGDVLLDETAGADLMDLQVNIDSLINEVYNLHFAREYTDFQRNLENWGKGEQCNAEMSAIVAYIDRLKMREEYVDPKGHKVYGFARMNGYLSFSEIGIYESPAYVWDADPGKAVVSVYKPGGLSLGFDYINHNMRNGVGELNKLAVGGWAFDDDDWETMKSAYNVNVIDMDSCTVKNIPDYAFSGYNCLHYVVLPRSEGQIGKSLFNDASLGAVAWNHNYQLPETVFESCGTNVLLYVNKKENAPQNFQNLVVDGVAESIRIAGEVPCAFYAPREFKVNDITFTSCFTQETSLNGGSGWETLWVPFDVQTYWRMSDQYQCPEYAYVDTITQIKPFAAFAPGEGYDAYKPFWLMTLGKDGFEPADRIKANKPYLISLPNNEIYSDEFIIPGWVEFWASNVTVPVTESKRLESKNFDFTSSIFGESSDWQTYVLNVYDAFDDYPAGSVFVPNRYDVNPFQAYITNYHGGAAYLPVRSAIDGDITGLESVSAESKQGLRVYVQDQAICIESPCSQTIAIYGISGVMVRSVSLQPGLNRVEGLSSGYYVVGNVKCKL